MTTADDVIALAGGFEGYAENPPGSNRTLFGSWYGSDGQPWCAMAVSYWFFHAGLPLPATTKRGFAYTPSGAAWFKQQGRWEGDHQAAVKKGTVVFFDFIGRISHIGIVTEDSARGAVLKTIEGNTDAKGGRTGGKVMRQLRSRASLGNQGGFGLPPYAAATPPAQGGTDVLVRIWKAPAQGPEESLCLGADAQGIPEVRFVIADGETAAALATVHGIGAVQDQSPAIYNKRKSSGVIRKP